MTSLFTSPGSSLRPDPGLAHRRAQATLTVTGEDGSPLAEQDVLVRQRDHAFGFGCIGFELIDWINGRSQDETGDAELARRWTALFNKATLPFYWGRFEAVRGEPKTAELRAAAQWFKDRGVGVKGHPLLWHTLTAPWLMDLGAEQIDQALRERIRREVADFSTVIDTWDAINEAVIMPVFTAEPNAVTTLARQKGRVAMLRLAFEEARAANPEATLLLNDFDMSTGYECLIEAALEAGVEIDRLGLQSHMHQGAWGEEKTHDVLERFSRFNIPIHFTETTILSGTPVPEHISDLNDWQVSAAQWPSTEEGEARQAEEIQAHYRRLFAHPAVESLTYWGLPDKDMWLNAPGGLLRRDGSPKPAYDRLHELIKGEWWTPETPLRTDEAGRVSLEGFLGGYELEVDGAVASFELQAPGASHLELRVPQRSAAVTGIR
ncbi:endo-1,4-beta-xylanase [Nesterenkonia sandarakina]|uniref:Beta-xylanase n=1 Tax=Nesterenkonia sandarakina TaxID=272918 RepID=A0A7Z0J2S5_9MICC|nr:endo-1,4-beta-xylanase [Nesterenkonia sandarakina]NYJ16028.1 GH35 family endo-1,4-beta-xylanase [Nesterenkonia sandarakina]